MTNTDGDRVPSAAPFTTPKRPARLLQISESTIRISDVGSLSLLAEVDFSLTTELMWQFLKEHNTSEEKPRPLVPPSTSEDVVVSINGLAALLASHLGSREVGLLVPLSRVSSSGHTTTSSSSSSSNSNTPNSFCTTLAQFLFHPSIAVQQVFLSLSEVVGSAIAFGVTEECLVIQVNRSNCVLARVKGGSTTRHAVTRVGGVENIITQDGATPRVVVNCAVEYDLRDPVYRKKLLALFGYRAYRYMLKKLRQEEMLKQYKKGGGGKGRGNRAQGVDMEWIQALTPEEKKEPGALTRIVSRVVGRPPFFSSSSVPVNTALSTAGLKGSRAFVSRSRYHENTVPVVVTGDGLAPLHGIFHLLKYICEYQCNESLLDRIEKELKRKRKEKKRMMSVKRIKRGEEGGKAQDPKKDTSPSSSSDSESLDRDNDEEEDESGSESEEDDDDRDTWLHLVPSPLPDSNVSFAPLLGANIATEGSCRTMEGYEACCGAPSTESLDPLSHTATRLRRFTIKEVNESEGSVIEWQSVF